MPLVLSLFIAESLASNSLASQTPIITSFCNRIEPMISDEAPNSLFKSSARCLCNEMEQPKKVQLEAFTSAMASLFQRDAATFKKITDIFKKITVDLEKKFGKTNAVFGFIHGNINDMTCLDTSNQDDKFAIHILSELNSGKDLNSVIEGYFKVLFEYIKEKYMDEIDRFDLFNSSFLFHNRLTIAKCVVDEYCRDGPCIKISDAIRIFQEELFVFVRDISKVGDNSNK